MIRGGAIDPSARQPRRSERDWSDHFCPGTSTLQREGMAGSAGQATAPAAKRAYLWCWRLQPKGRKRRLANRLIKAVRSCYCGFGNLQHLRLEGVVVHREIVRIPIEAITTKHHDDALIVERRR